MTPTFERARQAMLAEAQRPRAWSWRQVTAVVAGSLLGLLGVIAGGALASGATTLDVLALHWPAMLPVVSALLVACVAAFAPGARRARWLAAGLALSAAVLLVLVRTQSHASSTPEWVCTASHVGVAVLPAVVVLWALRRSAFTLLRAVVAGLAVGATGAFVGELVCERGAGHVLGFHLPAWLFSAVVVTWVASRLRPRSFAP
jgi:hypothetical protein